mgnify:FL=1
MFIRKQNTRFCQIFPKIKHQWALPNFFQYLSKNERQIRVFDCKQNCLEIKSCYCYSGFKAPESFENMATKIEMLRKNVFILNERN